MTGNLERAPAVWLCWALPSFADLFFLVLLGILAFSPMSAGLLRDADTGWHIRSGEQILATHAIPRTIPFPTPGRESPGTHGSGCTTLSLPQSTTSLV
jgi:hypothetical protein